MCLAIFSIVFSSLTGFGLFEFPAINVQLGSHAKCKHCQKFELELPGSCDKDVST